MLVLNDKIAQKTSWITWKSLTFADRNDIIVMLREIKYPFDGKAQIYWVFAVRAKFFGNKKAYPRTAFPVLQKIIGLLSVWISDGAGFQGVAVKEQGDFLSGYSYTWSILNI